MYDRRLSFFAEASHSSSLNEVDGHSSSSSFFSSVHVPMTPFEAINRSLFKGANGSSGSGSGYLNTNVGGGFLFTEDMDPGVRPGELDATFATGVMVADMIDCGREVERRDKLGLREIDYSSGKKEKMRRR